MDHKIKIKGIALAIIATMSFSNVYLFSKLAMKDINLPSFGIFWFGFALLYNLIYRYFFTSKKSLASLPSKSKKVLFLIGVSEFISITAFFLAINLTENPAIVSFLANTSPIFVIIIGFLFYQIRYRLISILGILTTLSGVLIMNIVDSEFNIKMLFTPASISALVFALFYGVSLLLARSEIKNIPTTMISICRNLFLLIGFSAYLLISWKSPEYTCLSITYIAIGSFLGSFFRCIINICIIAIY